MVLLAFGNLLVGVYQAQPFGVVEPPVDVVDLASPGSIVGQAPPIGKLDLAPPTGVWIWDSCVVISQTISWVSQKRLLSEA